MNDEKARFPYFRRIVPFSINEFFILSKVEKRNLQGMYYV